MSKKRDITGERFFWLVAIEPCGHIHGKSAWLCKCDCGENVVASLGDLSSGKKKSCGCYRKITAANTGKKCLTHGMTKSRLWNIWSSMKNRCKFNPHYVNVSVCVEWESFENFYDWAMNNGYDDSLTIDRIDVRGNYCPENCRWATYKEQENNKSNNVRINFNGRNMTVSEWGDVTGILPATISWRLKAGWPIEDIFMEPSLNNAKIRRIKNAQ